MSRQAESKGSRDPRTNMFIVAAIYADSGAAPVTIRNLSTTGALVEGPVLPTPGTRIRLSRGSLNVIGEIAWQRDGRAGLRFECTVSVADWLPQGRASNAQQRVDQLVRRARSARRGPDPRDPVERPTSQNANLDSAGLRQLRVEVQSLSEDLATDPLLVERFGDKLQTLDIVAQVLEGIASERWS